MALVRMIPTRTLVVTRPCDLFYFVRPEMNKWIARIDAMKSEFELKSDAQAAKLLGISQQALSQIRKGQIEMGPLTKLALLNKLGAMSS